MFQSSRDFWKRRRFYWIATLTIKTFLKSKLLSISKVIYFNLMISHFIFVNSLKTDAILLKTKKIILFCISLSFYDMLNLTCQVDNFLVQLAYVLWFFILHLLKALGLIHVLLDSLLLLWFWWFLFTIAWYVVVGFSLTLRWCDYIRTKWLYFLICWCILSLIIFHCIILGRYLMSRYLIIRVDVIMMLCSLYFFVYLLLS